jgi:hypothetical protein
MDGAPATEGSYHPGGPERKGARDDRGAQDLTGIIRWGSTKMTADVTIPEDEDWRNRLRCDGYAHFRGLCPATLVNEARQAIDHDLSTNYDPERQIEYDHRSFCPDLRGTAPIMALLLESGITAKLDEVIGFGRLGHDGGQIALRKAGNASEPEPPEPHIDGLPTPFNGVPSTVLVSNFTALVGIYLSPVRSEFSGNFTVWPGSHHILEAHCRRHGRAAFLGGMPRIPLGAPVQLMTEPGDVVLCHYELATPLRPISPPWTAMPSIFASGSKT